MRDEIEKLINSSMTTQQKRHYILSLIDDRWYMEEECKHYPKSMRNANCAGCYSSKRVDEGFVCDTEGRIRPDATIQEILDGKAVKR